MLTTFSNTHHTLHIKHVTHQGPHHLWNCRKIVGDEHQAILRSCTFNELKPWWNGTQSNNNLHRCWVADMCSHTRRGGTTFSKLQKHSKTQCEQRKWWYFSGCQVFPDLGDVTDPLPPFIFSNPSLLWAAGNTVFGTARSFTFSSKLGTFPWPTWSKPKQRERVTEPSLGGFGCLLCIQLHISWIRPYVGWKTPGRSEITGSLKLWVSCVLFKRSLPGILSRPNIHSVYRKQWGTRPMKWTARAKVRLICINDSKHLWPKPNAQVFTKVLAKLCW